MFCVIDLKMLKYKNNSKHEVVGQNVFYIKCELVKLLKNWQVGFNWSYYT